MEWDFSGEVVEWRGPAPHHFVAVPDDADAYLHDHLAELSYGWGCIPLASGSAKPRRPRH